MPSTPTGGEDLNDVAALKADGVSGLKPRGAVPAAGVLVAADRPVLSNTVVRCGEISNCVIFVPPY